MSARERNTRATRQRILEVCEHLFRTRGYDRTTIDEIISTADVSRQTFFNHFPGKQMVVTVLWLDWLDRQGSVPPADPDPFPPGGVLAAMRRAVVGQARAVEADQDFMALLFAHSSGFPGPTQAVERVRTETQDRAGRIFERVAAVVAAGQVSGEIRADINPRQAAEIYVSAMIMTMRLWLLGYASGDQTLEQRMVAAIDLLERGMSSDTGTRRDNNKEPTNEH